MVDDLSTHKPTALHEAFAPEEARRILGRLESVFTPQRGSRMNVAEIELSVAARQCLDGRIPGMDAIEREVAAREEVRDATAVKVDWHFATADARIKLKRLYPDLEPVNSGVANQ